MKVLKLLFCLFFLFGIQRIVYSQADRISSYDLDFVYKESRLWVDSVYNSLSPKEKIAQLFWIAVEIPQVQEKYAQLREEIEMMQPGGVILYTMESETARNVIPNLQSISKVPLFVAMDGEYGAGMRMHDMKRFPYAITMGAIEDDKLIYRAGLEMAKEFRYIGVNVNFAPVLDVNSLDLMPAIGFRAYGDNAENVKRKSVALMKGLQDGGIMAVGKHFPGHGNTDIDSHHKLPVNNHSLDSLRLIDLVPFQGYISAGGWGLMSGHIEVPALENEVPASFSPVALTSLLREQMKFKGLVVVDAINMLGASGMGEPGEIDVKALIAGNDVIVMPRDLNTSINTVYQAIEKRRITWGDIEEKCRRSLALKYWLMIRKSSWTTADRLAMKHRIGIPKQAVNLHQELYDSALTVVNGSGFEGIQNSLPGEYACVVLGDTKALTNEIGSRFGIPVYQLPLSSSFLFQEILNQPTTKQKLVVIIGLPNWGRSDVNMAFRNQLIAVSKKRGSIVVFLGNPYQLRYWPHLEDCDTFIMAYENTLEAQKAVVKLLLGKTHIRGQE